MADPKINLKPEEPVQFSFSLTRLQRIFNPLGDLIFHVVFLTWMLTPMFFLFTSAFIATHLALLIFPISLALAAIYGFLKDRYTLTSLTLILWMFTPLFFLILSAPRDMNSEAPPLPTFFALAASFGCALSMILGRAGLYWAYRDIVKNTGYPHILEVNDSCVYAVYKRFKSTHPRSKCKVRKGLVGVSVIKVRDGFFGTTILIPYSAVPFSELKRLINGE